MSPIAVHAIADNFNPLSLRVGSVLSEQAPNTRSLRARSASTVFALRLNPYSKISRKSSSLCAAEASSATLNARGELLSQSSFFFQQQMVKIHVLFFFFFFFFKCQVTRLLESLFQCSLSCATQNRPPQVVYILLRMSFFGRGLLIVAATAAVAHVFRKDIARLLPLLRRPAAAFLADVRSSLKEEITAADAREAKKGADQVSASVPQPPTPSSAVPVRKSSEEPPLR